MRKADAPCSPGWGRAGGYSGLGMAAAGEGSPPGDHGTQGGGSCTEQPRREQRWGAAVRMRSRTDPAVLGSPVLSIEKAFL